MMDILATLPARMMDNPFLAVSAVCFTVAFLATAYRIFRGR
jgi:hypothetical protein